MSAFPGERESKAICRPSGDQRGVPVTVLRCVSWRRLVPSLRHTQTSDAPLRVDSKAIMLPSGENWGPLSMVVEVRNRPDGTGCVKKFSGLLQMFTFVIWRAYTNRFPRIEGSVPSCPNCNRSALPPLAGTFQSQPDLASQAALPKTMSRPSAVHARPHPNCEPMMTRCSSPPATGIVLMEVTPGEPRLKASVSPSGENAGL